jgi:septum formation protein
MNQNKINGTQDILYLGSQSNARKNLLTWAKIPFKIITHTYDEELTPHRGNLQKLVLVLAEQKMKYLDLTSIPTQSRIFLVTADTLIGIPEKNQICGKPKDLFDAKEMLTTIAKQPIRVETGCCVSVQEKTDTGLKTINQKLFSVGATVEFQVSPENFAAYFQYEPNALYGCGASIIDSYGQLFFKSIHGSYSATLGLPLFELKNCLNEFNFKF